MWWAFTVTPSLDVMSQQNSVHAQLSCRVRNFVAISSLTFGLQINDSSIEFEKQWKWSVKGVPRWTQYASNKDFSKWWSTNYEKTNSVTRGWFISKEISTQRSSWVWAQPWEKALHSNASSHWLSPYPEWSMWQQRLCLWISYYTSFGIEICWSATHKY